MIPAKLLAQPLICQFAIIYADRIEMQGGVPRDQTAGGSKVYVFMRTMPGIDENQIKRVVFKHVDNDGKVNIYRPDVWCGENWPTVVGPCGAPAERMWLVPLAFPGRQLGKWIVTVKDSNVVIEKRRAFVDYFNFPLPPQNFWKWTDPTNFPGEVFLEWDASVGPPEFWRAQDSQHRGTYRVATYLGSRCSMKEQFQTSDGDVSRWWYDPTANRIGVRIPGHWVGTRVRISNIIMDGGFVGWPSNNPGLDEYFGTGGFSKAETDITLN
jgi:hypothetical protein